MAWNPSPEVAAARDAARKLGADRAVIFYTKGQQFGVASYGETMAKCAEAKKIGDAIFRNVEAAVMDVL